MSILRLLLTLSPWERRLGRHDRRHPWHLVFVLVIAAVIAANVGGPTAVRGVGLVAVTVMARLWARSVLRVAKARRGPSDGPGTL